MYIPMNFWQRILSFNMQIQHERVFKADIPFTVSGLGFNHDVMEA